MQHMKGRAARKRIYGLLSLRRDEGSGLKQLDLASRLDPRIDIAPKEDLRFFAPGLGKLPRT